MTERGERMFSAIHSTVCVKRASFGNGAARMISTVIPCAPAQVAITTAARVARGVATKRDSFLACIPIPDAALLQRLPQLDHPLVYLTVLEFLSIFPKIFI